MSELAKNITLLITPSGTKLLINGDEFQYHVAAEDLVVHGQKDGFAFARVSILAEQVTVSADLSHPDEHEAVTQPEKDQIPTAIEPKPWKKGWRFVMGTTAQPPDPVRTLRCVGDSSDFPLLTRTKRDLWAWISENRDPIDPGEGAKWSAWSNPNGSWASAEFEVVEMVWDPFE